jgi:signal transduction histidine kinase
MLIELGVLSKTEYLIPTLFSEIVFSEISGLPLNTSIPGSPFWMIAPYLRRLAEEEALGDVTVGELPHGTLHADPYRLTQVIRNLLVNARRHAGPTGWVAISAEASGARLTIRVDDDGPGISPADRERVFGRFHRSEASRARDSGGSGLGLAIVRSIVELHGGRIWVEGSPRGGARIAFELDGFEPTAKRPLRTG